MIKTPVFDVWTILPEVFLGGFAILGLLYEAFAPRSDRRVHLLLAISGTFASAAAAYALWTYSGPPTAMAGMVNVDRFSVFGRLLLVSIAAISLLLGTHYFSRDTKLYRGEFYPLVLFATMGMTLITAAADLIVVFLALEILSLSLYVLTGMTGRRGSNEAAMKYFLLGAFSSAVFLYGIAMAYGAVDSTSLAALAHGLSGQTGNQSIALLAVVLLLAGFSFKAALVPFHMWTPDVYQGAPTPVTGFMSAATKAAAFLALIRVFDVAFQPLTWNWVPLIWVIAAVTMVVGAVFAVAQSDIKRMLAYSSILNAGYILVGLTAANSVGIRAGMFYLVAYAATSVGAFGVVMLVSARGDELTSLDTYRGLARRSPFLAAIMTLFLLSLAGIPPAAGFIAKVEVFSAALHAGNWSLVLIGAITSVVAAFVYLRVVVLMYMEEPDGDGERDTAVWPRAVLAIPALGVLVLGVVPGVILKAIDAASVLRW
ncbi:MAG: NADH-quinone oxidoreductase subunit [Actinomycetota bacterium]|nr:NADH-quinone oxidoreductase subunit [Actinomycetota bacterium]